MATKADIRAGRAFVELFVKGAQLEAGLNKASAQLRQFADSAKQLGQSLVAVATPAAIGIGLATMRFADFDDQMRTVAAVSQMTERQLADLTATAEQLGASTSFTAVQVGSLMTELGRAGFNADEIKAMTGAVLDLARASGTDATISSGIMSATIRQFGLAAGDATRVADALTAAANLSFNSVEQLGEAMNYAGPVAHDFNMSLEEALAIFGGLGNMGIQASNAGTAVRRLLTLTGAEADKMREIFGVSFKDAAGDTRPLIDVLEEVNEATRGMPTAERAAKFNEAFGLLGITAASAIGATTVSIRELKRELDNASGTARKTAQQMDAGLGGSFRILLSAVEAVGIKIGRVLSPAIKAMADSLTGVATEVVKWIGENRGAVISIGAFVAAVGSLGFALIGLGIAIKAASVAIAWLATAVGIATSPWAAGAIMVGAFTAAVVHFSGIVPQIVKQMQPLVESLNQIGEALVAGDWDAFSQAAELAVNYMVSLFADAFRQIPDFAAFAGTQMAGAMANPIMSMIDWLMEGIVNALAGVAPEIATIFASVLEQIRRDISELAIVSAVPPPALQVSAGTVALADAIRNRSKASREKRAAAAEPADPFAATSPPTSSTTITPAATPPWLAGGTASALDGSAVNGYKDKVGELSSLLWEGKISMEEYDKRLKTIKDELVGVSPIEQYKRKIEELTQALKDGTITSKEFEKGRAEAKATALGIDSTPLEKYKERVKDLGEAFAMGSLTTDEYNSAMAEAKAGVFDSSPIEKYHAKVKELKAAFDEGIIDENTFKNAQMDALPANVKRIIEQAKSPLEKFNEQITEARDLFDAGLINREQFAAEQERLQGELRRDSGETKKRERVSVSFSAAALIAQGQGGGGGQADAIPSKLDLQLIELRRQNDLLRKIEAKEFGGRVR